MKDLLDKTNQKIYEDSVCFELNDNSEGVFNIGCKTASLPFILPGEKITVSAQKRKKKTNYFLEKINSYSALRGKSMCSHFGECGGCLTQHMNEQLYKEFKKSLVTKALMNEGLDTFLCNDPIFFGSSLRRRANLDGIKKEEEMILGFHKYKRHSITNVKDCVMLNKNLFNVLDPLRKVFAQTLRDFQKVKVFMLDSSTGIDIGFEIQGSSEIDSKLYKDILEVTFKDFNNIARIFFRHRKHKEVLLYKCDPKMSYSEVLVDVDAYSFVQACKNMDMFLEDFIKRIEFKNAMDLFCGIGTMTLPLSKKGNVIGFEFDEKGVERLELVGINAKKRDLFLDPVKDFSGFDLICINPPRAGAINQVNEIVKSNVSKIIYLSCNPKTMARDLKILSSRYKIESIQPIDQFFGSPHIECLSELSIIK